MKDITVIIPIHEFAVNNETDVLLDKAINSVIAAQAEYPFGELKVLVVSPQNQELTTWLNNKNSSIEVLANNGLTDFCSQINFAIEHITTEHFSILEYDDEYTPKWFKMAHDYYFGNESISAFLPVNLFHNGNGEDWQYGNTMALSPAFMTPDENDTDEIGIINFGRLEKCSLFNLTGAVINTNDFKEVGGYKPSIKIAFNYELLLRMTKKGLKAMVVPKEGYIHAVGRKGSLTDEYLKSTTEKEREQWFDLALRECLYTEDRNKGIASVKDEQIK